MMIHGRSLILIPIFFVVQTAAPQQRPAKPPPSKKPAVSKHGPVYEMRLRIIAGGKLTVAMLSPAFEPYIDPLDLAHLITDLPAGGDEFNTPSNAFPKVVVEADPTVSMLGFWNPLTLFRTNRTDIRVLIDDETSLQVVFPQDTEIAVKPNPLTLDVTLDDTGKISLNNDGEGTLADTAKLKKHLEEIFKARLENGVFHENSNDVETAVTIIIPMGERKFADVKTIAAAVHQAGARWINLSMRSEFPERREILDLPLAPPKKKP